MDILEFMNILIILESIRCRYRWWAENDESGYSVSLSSDGSTVAIGAPYNGNESNPFNGHLDL